MGDYTRTNDSQGRKTTENLSRPGTRDTVKVKSEVGTRMVLNKVHVVGSGISMVCLGQGQEGSHFGGVTSRLVWGRENFCNVISIRVNETRLCVSTYRGGRKRYLRVTDWMSHPCRNGVGTVITPYPGPTSVGPEDSLEAWVRPPVVSESPTLCLVFVPDFLLTLSRSTVSLSIRGVRQDSKRVGEKGRSW